MKKHLKEVRLTAPHPLPCASAASSPLSDMRFLRRSSQLSTSSRVFTDDKLNIGSGWVTLGRPVPAAGGAPCHIGTSRGGHIGMNMGEQPKDQLGRAVSSGRLEA